MRASRPSPSAPWPRRLTRGARISHLCWSLPGSGQCFAAPHKQLLSLRMVKAIACNFAVTLFPVTLSGMIGRSSIVAACLALLWFVLSEADSASWLVGVPAVAVGSALSCLLPPRQGELRLRGVLQFIVHFAGQAVRGAWDVALLALGPGRRVAPGFIDYPLQLPVGTARTVFLNSVTLLPGTLTADVTDNVARVHVIDLAQGNIAELRKLEERVAAVFGAPAFQP